MGPAAKTVGADLSPVSHVVTMADMLLFEPEGEKNIHTDDAIARAAGLPAAIAAGVQFMSYIFEMLRQAYGPDSVAGTVLDVRIRAPVFAGDMITSRGRVTGVVGNRALLDVSCENQRGEQVIGGTAEVPLVEERPEPRPRDSRREDMSDWKEILGGKLVAPEAAVSGLSSGDKVACGLTEPTDLLTALARREDIRDVMVVDAVLVFGGAAVATAGGRFRVIVGFATPVSYELQKKGLVEYIPLQFSQAHRWVEEQVNPDSVMLRLTPPTSDGLCSYGWAPGYTPDLVRLAKERGLPLIAEIDATMPYTISNEQVPVEAITCAIECSGPPEGGDVPALASDKSGAIAVHLNPLVPDGATLQVGIGSVPDAAVSLLVDKKDLGIHTEVLNEGLIELMEAGRGDRGPQDAQSRQGRMHDKRNLGQDRTLCRQESGRPCDVVSRGT